MDAYGYCYQNPIIFIDPNGMWGVKIISEVINGKTTQSIRFVAEIGDDIKSLSVQLGVSVNELQKLNELKDLTITECTEISLSEIGIISKMNEFINGEYNNSKNNCKFFATEVNGTENSPNIFECDTTFLSGYDNVSVSNSKLGDIITFNHLFEDYHWEFFEEEKTLNPKATKSQFFTYYKKVQENIIEHFALVILKTKDGKGIQNTIEKGGPNPVKINTLNSKRTVTEKNGKTKQLQTFGTKPARSSDSSPVYRKKDQKNE